MSYGLNIEMHKQVSVHLCRLGNISITSVENSMFVLKYKVTFHISAVTSMTPTQEVYILSTASPEMLTF